MTNDEFKNQWTHILDQYKAKRDEATAYLDREAARLFTQSKWTQQRIADQIGKDQKWVSRRLKFGAFLDFRPIGLKLDSRLTEGKFRSYWEKTDKSKKDHPRFRQVVEMMIDNGDAKEGADRLDTVGHIRESCCDGKWHSVDDIKEDMGIEDDPKDRVLNCVRRIETNNNGNLMVAEKKLGPGGVKQYKFKELDGKAKAVKAGQLVKEIEPIIKELERSLNITIKQDAVACAKGELQRIKKVLKEYL